MGVIMLLSPLAQVTNPIIVGNARFTVIAPECIRLEYAESGKFIDEPSLFAIHRTARYDEFIMQKNEDGIVIDTSKIVLIYRPNNKPFSSENLTAIIKIRPEKSKDANSQNSATLTQIQWTPDLPNNNNLGGTVRTLDQARGKFPLDDGLLSRNGWYLLDDSKRPILVNNWVASRPKSAGTDWYLFGYGLDYKVGLKAFATIAGKIPLPRKYLLGSWYSRYWPYSSKEYHEIVEEYHQNNFPLDIIVMDMDWHREGWTGWSWNRDLLPDAEDLLQWFKKQGLAVTLNIHPADGVKPHEDMYVAFMQDMGIDVSQMPREQWPTIPFDAANQKYLDTLFKHTHTPMENLGVDFWWLDWQQFEFTRGNPEVKNLEWLNHYYFQHTSKGNLRGASFSRWGGWGDHRHPIHFSGDAVSIWPMLEFEVPFTTIAGNMGCFFWSHDIGGHFGGLTQETNARWVQFGAMSAALRLHSTRDANMDKRPWKMDKNYIESMRTAFHTRSILMPYIYSSAAQSCQETIPLTRPMYIDYPEKDIAYHCPQQYLLGNAILVAPITEPGTGAKKIAKQHIWFPEGNWYNWFTGELETDQQDTMYAVYDFSIQHPIYRITAPKAENQPEFVKAVWADINEFPLYVKGGIPIPLQAYTPRMATAPLDNLIVRVYPGQSGEFTLYEDDGLTKDYQQGKFATTKLQYQTSRDENGNFIYTITIEPTQGVYSGQLEERSYTIEFAYFLQEGTVSAYIQKQPTNYEPGDIKRIQIPKQSIRQPLVVSLRVAPPHTPSNPSMQFFTPQNEINLKAQQKRVEYITEYIKEATNLEKKEISSYDLGHFYSILSGISWFKESEQEISLCIDKPHDFAIEVQVIDHIGDKAHVIYTEHLPPLSSSKRFMIRDPMTSFFGAIVRREIVASYKLNDINVSIAQTLDERDTYLPECLLLGPFAFDRNKNITEYVHTPETQNLATLPTEYVDRDGKPITWIKADCQSDFIIDIRSRFDCDDAIAYALVYLESEVEQAVKLELNSDDGIEVWLNQEKLFSHNVFRPVFHDPDLAHGTLKPGKNTLLLKISQGVGGWCFKVKILAEKSIRYTLEPQKD